jgi:hypothetical protein
MNECKKCSRCKKILPLENFSISNHGERQRYCKKCKAEYIKEMRPQINRQERARYLIMKINRIEEYLKYEKDHIERIKFRRSNMYKSLRDSGFCLICGTIKDLCIHHIDENPLNNSLENLKILCRKHHSLHHRTSVQFSSFEGSPPMNL